MRLLLDTHAFLWVAHDDPRLGPAARKSIVEAVTVLVSAASAWEAGIKHALGRLHLPGSFAQGVEESGFNELPVRFEHARVAGGLPLHHRDPFDRMLVAQAICENLTLVTHDRKLEPYAVPTLWL